MQLIQICPTYRPAYTYGGPTVSISMLCEHMQESCIKPLVLTTTGNGNTELNVIRNSIVNVAGVQVRYFRRVTKDHSHFSPALCLHLWRHIRNNKKSRCDELIIHIHSWWNLVSIFSCLIARLYNIKTIISPRGMLTTFSFNNTRGPVKKLIHLLVGKWLLNGSYLHATSEKEKQDILSFLQPIHISVIPNMVRVANSNMARISKWKPESFKIDSSQTLSLLFFSRIDEKKGIEVLFQAVSELKIKYSLTIAGTGSITYINKLKTLCKTLGIEQRVRWIGSISYDEKFDVLSNYDLMILPSYNENFANVVVESLSVGTPVLVSDQVGLADYVIKTKLGWVSKLSFADFAAQINHISTDRKKLLEIKIEGPQHISRDFNSKTLLKQYLNFYKGVAASTYSTQDK